MFNDRDVIEAYEFAPKKDQLKIYTMADTRIESHQMAKEYLSESYWTKIEVDKIFAAKEEIEKLETELGSMMY